MNFIKNWILAVICWCMLCVFPGCSKSVPAAPERTFTTKSVVLVQGDTLGASIAELGVSAPDQKEIIDQLGTIFNLRRCRSGDRYEIAIDTVARWSAFEYYPAGLEYFSVTKSSANIIAAQRKTKQGTHAIHHYRGMITTSLWESMAAQNIAPELIMSFADIFSWQIDFLTEPRTGDRYRLSVEEFTATDGKVLTARIIAAQYLPPGKTFSGILFTHAGGKSDYYDIDGKSLQSAFLRAPLQYRRISSFFTKRRFHPILKIFRQHLGIDYAAPAGTPVSSIGEGVVRFAGRKGGFGNDIVIAHPNGYASYYGHLRGYAHGIRAGQHVRQGQVVGYVGTTGLSTGPHLDFRVSLRNTFINFLSIKAASVRSIAPEERAAFKTQLHAKLTELSSIRDASLR